MLYDRAFRCRLNVSPAGSSSQVRLSGELIYLSRFYMEKKEISYKRLIVVVVIGTIVIEVFGGGGFFRIA